MKYLYMDEQEWQIQYYQFPKFLLELQQVRMQELFICCCMTGREYHERIIGQMRMEEYMQYFQLRNYHRKPGSANFC